jgi:dienelactone hydrolase
MKEHTLAPASPGFGKRILAPPFALVDATLSVQVVGMEPFRTVTVRAVMRPQGRLWWESHATFQADAQGAIDLSTHKPQSGTYEQTDPMGLFWSMSLQSAQDMDSIAASGLSLPAGTVRVLAEVDSQIAAWTDIVRKGKSSDVAVARVRENGLAGTFYRPVGPGPFPAVLVLGGSDGGIENPARQSALLASHGFAALAPAYFRYEHLPRYLLNIPLEYFQTAIEWLVSNPDVKRGSLGVVGRSRGAELALILGATFPEVKCVVAYVPSDRANPSFGNLWEDMRWPSNTDPLTRDLTSQSSPSARKQRPAWLSHGQPLGYSSIPVERIRGPVLLISGKQDPIWASAQMSEQIIKRLQEFQHPYADEHLSYDHAGHMISFPYMPTTLTRLMHPVAGSIVDLGGSAQGNAFANADSWPRVLQFLGDNLRGES